jgi:hypothetical protein
MAGGRDDDFGRMYADAAEASWQAAKPRRRHYPVPPQEDELVLTAAADPIADAKRTWLASLSPKQRRMQEIMDMSDAMKSARASAPSEYKQTWLRKVANKFFGKAV